MTAGARAEEDPPLPVGKLDPSLLRELLPREGPLGGGVRVGPGIGQDVAIVSLDCRCLALKTDPVTFATRDLPRHLLLVNANDLVTCGARPRWLLVTLLLPEGRTTASMVRDLFAQLRSACSEMGVVLVGGHTEVTQGLDRPIAVGHLIGEVEEGRWIATSGARAGDQLLLTKGVAIEAVALLAREKAGLLRQVGFDDAFIRRCEGFIDRPGIGVVGEGQAALSAGGVTAMHDPTEGGLATALHELAEASSAGLRVLRDRVPVYPECAEIAARLRLDPFGMMASGALLVAVAPAEAERVARSVREAGVPCCHIGQLVEKEEGRLWCVGGVWEPIPLFSRDEIARLWSAGGKGVGPDV